MCYCTDETDKTGTVTQDRRPDTWLLLYLQKLTIHYQLTHCAPLYSINTDHVYLFKEKKDIFIPNVLIFLTRFLPKKTYAITLKLVFFKMKQTKEPQIKCANFSKH